MKTSQNLLALFNTAVLFTLILYFVSCQAKTQTQDDGPAKRLRDMGVELPEMSAPVANYVKYVKTGNLLFLSGHGACEEGKPGKVGSDLTIEEGYEAARLTGLCMLSTLHHAVDGDWSRVKQIVKVLGMVNSSPDFYEQPKVVNGCSDLMVEVFGEKGKHARAAVGMASLPGNIPIEIEMIVELTE
ncbi:MAG: RidA family protein [Cyclobacteriaceae bacterium]|nr:RidA family protein [Cyclobacteriaceae bacterium]